MVVGWVAVQILTLPFVFEFRGSRISSPRVCPKFTVPLKVTSVLSTLSLPLHYLHVVVVMIVRVRFFYLLCLHRVINVIFMEWRSIKKSFWAGCLSYYLFIVWFHVDFLCVLAFLSSSISFLSLRVFGFVSRSCL